MKIAGLDIPEALKDFYIASGIDELYEPQGEAVKKGLLQGRNLLVSIPTASGKTLLAEMAMLKSIAGGGKAIYIVPLKALAAEKYDRFQEFSKLPIKEDGVKVGIATGDYDSRDEYLGEKDIIVATSEKTDSLLRNGASWLSSLSVVVADEVHLIDSASRGPTLEVTLSKLRKLNRGLQILALSATIGNAKALAKWLGAELISSEWRPTVLKEGVFFGRAITFKTEKRVVSPAGPDEILSLVADTLNEGGQCLVFAGTRKGSESIAQKVARSLSKRLTPEEKERYAGLKQLVLRHAETETCVKLADCVACGTAFHHAGLKGEHRRIVEDAFKKNILKVIACTPTLAAGLNLPARRVIIRDYRRFDVNYGSVPIPVLEYKQMAGRAGRPRLDPYGEAVLIAKSYEEFEELMENYVMAEPEHIMSKLGTEPAMRAHVLSAVATGFCRSRQDLRAFMDTTFFAFQRGDLSRVIDNVLDFLLRENMIVENRGDRLKATELGTLTSRLYIDPLSASLIARGLSGAAKRHEITDFGLLHLICSTPDIRSLYLRRGDYSWIIHYADEHASDFLIDVPDTYDDDIEFEQFLAGVKTAALCEMWINEKSEDTITTFFNIGPGDIRNLMETCTWLMHGTAEISRLLRANATTAARELATRIESGASRELLDLIVLRGVGRVRARKLYDAGFTSREKLKNADVAAIASVPSIGERLAVNILNQLGRKVEHTTPVNDEPSQQLFGQSTLFSFEE
ncbi:MAG TPA: ATP-dependent DNA helicase [Methanocella sp.]|nr:ATP-dependent DNA helicase [Methanocella sp.]